MCEKKENVISVVQTDKAPAAIGPYCQAVVMNDVLYTSGQIPIDPSTGEMTENNIEAQTLQVMKNLQAVLEEAGSSFENVLKTTCFLSDMEYFGAFNSIYEKYFTGKPARSCVAVKELPKKALVEVELIAVIKK